MLKLTNLQSSSIELSNKEKEAVKGLGPVVLRRSSSYYPSWSLLSDIKSVLSLRKH